MTVHFLFVEQKMKVFVVAASRITVFKYILCIWVYFYKRFSTSVNLFPWQHFISSTSTPENRSKWGPTRASPGLSGLQLELKVGFLGWCRGADQKNIHRLEMSIANIKCASIINLDSAKWGLHGN